MIVVGYSNNQLTLYEGTMKNNHLRNVFFYTEDVEPGLVINGIIQDKQKYIVALQALLKKAKIKKNSKVTITIDSSSIIYRETQIPKLNKKQTNLFVYHTFASQVPNIDDYVIDYTTIEEGKNSRILCIAAPNILLKPYHDVMKKCNLTITHITSSVNELLKFGEIQILNNFICISINHDVITSMAYINKTYQFANVGRIFTNTNIEVEILTRINQILQFEKIQNPDVEFEGAYIFGKEDFTINESQLDVKIIGTSELKNIDMKLTSMNALAAACIFDVNRKQANLAEGIKKQQTKKYGKRYLQNRLWLVIIMNMLVIFGICGRTEYKYYQATDENMRLHELYEDSAFTGNLEQANRYMLLHNTIQPMANEFEHIVEDRKKGFDYSAFATVFNLSDDVVIQNYNYSNNISSFHATSNSNTAPYQFIRRLEESKMFDEVNYNGYSFDAAKEKYSFDVQLVLKGGKNNE